MNQSPLRRDPALIPLSHDHHHALVAAVRLKKGASAFSDEPDAVKSIRRLWSDELEHHFVQEESVLFAREWPDDVRDMVARAIREHARIREMVGSVDTGKATEDIVRNFGELLEAHIRFEERQLFGAMQESLSEQELLEIGRELARSE